MATPKEILESMGIDPEEAIRVDQELITRPKGDKRICLCGHSVSRHDMTFDRPSCVVGKQFCPCKKIQPMITVEDTRPFIRKTEGAANLHAFARGLAAAIERGQEMEKIETSWVCHKCGTADGRLSPIPVSQHGTPVDYATGYDALLCDQCRVNR